MPTEGTEHMSGQLAALEWTYAELTERDLIASTPDENGHRVWRLDDGSEAHSLPSAVDHGRALVRFAANMLKQSAG